MRFFVYDLIDPRDGRTFYVGKGVRDRPQHHTAQARKGHKSDKCDLIREILASGRSVRVEIVARFADEDEAFAFEAERIASIGLDNLTNVLPGGRGGSAGGLSDDDKFPLVAAKAMGLLLGLAQQGKRVSWGGMDVTQFAKDCFHKYMEEYGPDFLARRFDEAGFVLLTGDNNAVC
jgi:hypothetical protein